MTTQDRLLAALRRRGFPPARSTCPSAPAGPPTEDERRAALEWLARQLTWETRLTRMRAAHAAAAAAAGPSAAPAVTERPDRVPVPV